MTTENSAQSMSPVRCIAFAGDVCIAHGDVLRVAKSTKEFIERGETSPILIFDEATSEPLEIGFRGELEEVLERLRRDGWVGAVEDSDPRKRGRGRPKLGVVAREVTLLPRHWEWLNEQPGGASVALRKLVEAARRGNAERDRLRKAQESAYRFMSAMAGNLAGFEEATRALFAREARRFAIMIETWPTDIREHARRLTAGIWGEGQGQGLPPN
jgi:hypothetical protein